MKNYFFFKRNLKKKLQLLKPDDYLYLQYPFYMGRYVNKVIINEVKKKSINTVLLIHDLNSLRFGGEKEIQSEINYLNNFNVIVAHNESMVDWLKKNNCNSEIINLEIFDYYTEGPDVIEDSQNDKVMVCFAGNLIKSDFIYKLSPQDYTLNLYGSGFKKEKLNTENVIYNGSYTPNDLVNEMKGKFGLVWDGTEVNNVSGIYGKYIQYNNPHKASLYLACGIPIIIWKNAALSKFVEESGVGISIESLDELDSILSTMTVNEYQKMKENSLIISKKLRNGYYTKKAFAAAENSI